MKKRVVGYRKMLFTLISIIFKFKKKITSQTNHHIEIINSSVININLQYPKNWSPADFDTEDPKYNIYIFSESL